MKRFLLAVMATILSTGIPSFAEARDRPSAWNQAPAQAQSLEQACYGDKRKKKLTICSASDPLNGLKVIDIGTRPPGAQNNHHMTMVVATDPNGNIIRNEAGVPILLAGHATGTANWQAVMQQGVASIPGALFNGAAAAGINAAFGACNGGNCGGGVVNLVTANAGSVSSANVAAALGGGGCPSGGCPPPKP